MPHFGPTIKTKWLKIDTSPVELLAISDAYQWNCHWTRGSRRSYRCTGNDCNLCAQGEIPSERYVLLVEDQRGKAHFLELRERHRQTLEDWSRYTGTVCGVRFTARKRYDARNAPVDIDFVSYSKRKEILIGNFVASLGADPRQREIGTRPPTLSSRRKPADDQS